jgi:cysteine desulfurase
MLIKMDIPTYLDCNATTPLEGSVLETLLHYLTVDYGNEGSRTHEYGSRAKQAVQKARDQVGAVVAAKRDEVLFTSGATESNNIAILGLAEEGIKKNKKHVITTRIEHKAVLEPFELLEKQGFEVSWIEVGPSGRVDPKDVANTLRDDTLLVSIMQANNETGIIQPLDEICELLKDHSAYFHTDAAQAYGKELSALKNERIDLISVSAHKIHGPKGIGALIARRRGFRKCPLTALVAGGGQERGIRPGTLPVALIAALGEAARLAEKDAEQRRQRCLQIRKQAIDALATLQPQFTGEQDFVMPHVLNLAISDIDSEALILSLKDLIAISNGSACTSTSYSPSHVLKAMGMTDDEANSCIRISWSHLTSDIDWDTVTERIKSML